MRGGEFTISMMSKEEMQVFSKLFSKYCRQEINREDTVSQTAATSAPSIVHTMKSLIVSQMMKKIAMTMTSRTYYETGIETPEILGSGSSFSSVITTSDENEAFQVYRSGNRNYLLRVRLSDGTKNRNVGEHERPLYDKTLFLLSPMWV